MRSASSIARAAWTPVGSGALMWKASEVSAPPATVPYGRAPRAWACAADSTTSTTAPSPNTNPSRSASNGRLACAGASLRSDSGPISASPANIARAIPASVPPATTTSASPPRISRRASSTAAVPLAQASALAVTGPCAPRSIATSQAAMLRIVEGT